MLAAVLIVVAAANLAVVFALISIYHPIVAPASDIGSVGPFLAIGVIPFLLVAALIAWTLVRTRATFETDSKQRQIAGQLLAISGFGLPLMIVCGFWAALYAATVVQPNHLPGEDVLYIYQVTFVAAIVADGVTLVFALVSRFR
jgi:hypothetical protein